jgi:type I restriction enzyme S subunit
VRSVMPEGFPDSWQILPLEDCMAAIIDYRGKTPDKKASGIPLVTAKVVKNGRIETPDEFIAEEDYADWMRRGLPKIGDIVMTTEAPLGEIAQLDDRKVALAQRLITLRGKADFLDNTYLKFLMQSAFVQDNLRARATGTTVLGIRQSELRKVPLVVPPFVEQQGIASVLGALDDKIELNRRMNDTLEALAQSLFKSWFVDFDPVRAQMSGKPISGLDPTVSLFPKQFQNSELGEIPKGWTVKSIEEVSSRVAIGPFGSSIKVETFVSDGMPVISGQHLHGLMLEDSIFNFITQAHAERLKNSLVQRGDVVFTHAGNIGQVAFIPEHSRYERYIISQRQFFMRCDLSQVTPSFVTFYFKSHEGQHRLLANTSSSGVPSIARPVTNLRSIRLTIPSKPVLDAFESFVRPILIQVRRNDEQSRTLAALRDALLPKLLSGELRVPIDAASAEES